MVYPMRFDRHFVFGEIKGDEVAFVQPPCCKVAGKLIASVLLVLLPSVFISKFNYAFYIHYVHFLYISLFCW